MDPGGEVNKCSTEVETPEDPVASKPTGTCNASPTAETFKTVDDQTEPFLLNESMCSPLVLNDSAAECQEIDPVSSKPTSEVEEGQILDSSSDAADLVSGDQPRCSLLKRSNSVLSIVDHGHPKKLKRKISFSAVTAYYFPRAQGFTCVPSQGGSTLGMALRHSHEEILTINEHASQQRQKHRR